MNLDNVKRMSRFASRVELMRFYEMDGHLHFQGLFAVEPYEKQYLSEFSDRLNDAILKSLAVLSETLKEEIRVEANK